MRTDIPPPFDLIFGLLASAWFAYMLRRDWLTGRVRFWSGNYERISNRGMFLRVWGIYAFASTVVFSLTIVMFLNWLGWKP